MIISRTPFRVSFFGGGTDYPAWFKEHGGAVLATTIDKYCYISVRVLPPFFAHRYRLVFRPDGSFDLQPIILPRERQEELASHLMLFFSGISRYSSDIAQTKVDNIANRARELTAMYEMVDQAIDILRNPATAITEFG